MTLSGLVVSIYILGPIRSLATPLDFNRHSRKDYNKHFTFLKQTFRTIAFSTLADDHNNAKEQAPSASAIILSDFWKTLESRGNLQSLRSSKNQIAFDFVDICTRSNWTPIRRASSNCDGFLNWIIANQDLPYRGRSLRQWVEEHSREDAYQAKRKRYLHLKRMFSINPQYMNMNQEILVEAVADAFDWIPLCRWRGSVRIC